MRTWIPTLTVLALLISLACNALAADPTPRDQREVPRIEPVPMTTRAHALLTGSPYQAEILKIRERSAAREAWLYEKLRRTDDELQVRRIVACLERLETDTELKLLNVQARYARLAGMLDLEREIRARILEVKELDAARLAAR